MIKLSSISSAILSIRDNDCALWVFSASCRCQDANRVCRMYISANRENLIFLLEIYYTWKVYFWLSKAKENILKEQVYLNINRKVVGQRLEVSDHYMNYYQRFGMYSPCKLSSFKQLQNRMLQIYWSIHIYRRTTTT